MPLKVQSLAPEVAFDVKYQGKIIPIFHFYQDDRHDRKVEAWYTADKDEGVRSHQSRQSGLRGDFGYTETYQRDNWYFCTDTLFNMMRSLPEFNDLQDPNYKYSYQYEDSFILQTAIDHGLVGFDEEYRFIDTTMIEEPIKSCFGGWVYPYEATAWEASNG